MSSRKDPPPGLILNLGIQQDSNSPQSRPRLNPPVGDIQSAPITSAASSQDSINQLTRSAQNLSLGNANNSPSMTRKPRPQKIDLGRGFNAAQLNPSSLDNSEPENTGVSVHEQQMMQQNQLREQIEQSTAENIVKQYQQDLKDEDFETLDELGVGSGGTVYRVRHKPTNAVMAKKLIHQLDFKISKEIISELRILDKCKSDFIVSFYGAYAVQGELCICMEFMDVGSFEKILKIARKIPERVLGKTTVSVLNGLTYLYETLRIIHRDIKPSNILINSKGHVKLCDFGVSKALEGSLLNVESFIGTSAYMSPERIEGKNYTAKCDTWAFGLTLLELATGRYPFHSDTYEALNNELGGENESPDWGGDISVFEILQQITTHPAPTLPGHDEPGGDEYTDEFRDFIAASLRKDPNSRPAPSTLLNHPFVRNSARQVVDMAAWARQYLDPNLDAAQMTRWDVAQRQKRKSITTAKENRLNLKQANANHTAATAATPHHPPGSTGPLAATTESITEDEELNAAAFQPSQPALPMQPPPRKLPINLAPPPMKPRKPVGLSRPSQQQ